MGLREQVVHKLSTKGTQFSRVDPSRKLPPFALALGNSSIALDFPALHCVKFFWHTIKSRTSDLFGFMNFRLPLPDLFGTE